MNAVYLRTGKKPGAWNMALDDMLFELVSRGDYDLIFRTYMWKPACISFGRLQKPESEININKLLIDGFHIVRRPTGGRAVWHEHEVTYSIIAPVDHPLVSGSINDSLRKISAPIVSTFQTFGLSAEVTSSDYFPTGLGPGEPNNPCFTSHGRWEITIEGRKIVGSAQARKNGVFLEHGSIIFSNDQPKIIEYFPSDVSEAWRKKMYDFLSTCVGSLKDYIDNLDPYLLQDRLLSSFESTVGVQFRKISVQDLDIKRLSELIEIRQDWKNK